MKLLKRNQMLMLSLAFMVMIAGYINYRYDPKREENLGSTVKVDSNKNVNVYLETFTDKDESLYKDKEDNEKSLGTFKSSRDNMLSELESTYKELISVNVSSSEIKIYNEKLDEIIKKKNLIKIVEDMIKLKGIEEVVIIPNDDSYNVMIGSKNELTKSQIAMIEKLLMDEFNINAEKIKIIVKSS
ncbi:MAG: SpoIIIAH-like family protein [Clostridia bacterium]|nr:SpoIIIAH-like family protein [Bacilli bacterium]MBR6613538.1 SpoIIIAH-like family protein [Clostridia bacterium]MBR6641930.1 SpoIIIAH-like family protein [Clostridia bacterium]